MYHNIGPALVLLWVLLMGISQAFGWNIPGILLGLIAIVGAILSFIGSRSVRT